MRHRGMSCFGAAACAAVLLCAAGASCAAQNPPLTWNYVPLNRQLSPSCRLASNHGEVARYLQDPALHPNFPAVDWNNQYVLVITGGDFAPREANVQSGYVVVTGYAQYDPNDNVVIAVSKTYGTAWGCRLMGISEQADAAVQPVQSSSWTSTVMSALSADGSEQQSAPPPPPNQKHRLAARPGGLGKP